MQGETSPGNPQESGADQAEETLINPNPSQPLVWQSRTPETDLTQEEQRQENLEQAGISESDIRNTMQEYYEDCRKLLDYWNGYVEEALKELGADDFVIQLQVERLGGGYYRLYHNVYTD